MIPGAFAVLTIVLFIRETRAGSLEKVQKPKFNWSSLGRSYKIFIAVVVLFSIGNSSDAFLILQAQNVGIPLAIIPLVYLVFNLVYALGALPAGLVSDRIGPRPIILMAFILFGFIYLGFAEARQPMHIWLLFVAYGLFMAMTEGVQKAFLATLVPAEFKATGFGLYNTLVGVSLLPASLVGGYLWDRLGPRATFMYGSFTAWLAALLFIFFLIKYNRSSMER